MSMSWRQSGPSTTSGHTQPPTPKSAASASRWGRKGSAASARRGTSGGLEHETLAPGQIVYLPQFHELVDSSAGQYESHIDTYGHPCLILRLSTPPTSPASSTATFPPAGSLLGQASTAYAEVMPITSSDSTPLRARTRRRDAAYVAAHRLIDHPANNGEFDNTGFQTLHLASTKPEEMLTRPSYVRVDKNIRIELHNLRWFKVNGRVRRNVHLAADSLEYVLALRQGQQSRPILKSRSASGSSASSDQSSLSSRFSSLAVSAATTDSWRSRGSGSSSWRSRGGSSSSGDSGYCTASSSSSPSRSPSPTPTTPSFPAPTTLPRGADNKQTTAAVTMAAQVAKRAHCAPAVASPVTVNGEKGSGGKLILRRKTRS